MKTKKTSSTHDSQSFNLQLIQRIWTIEQNGFIWYEFEETEEQAARHTLAELESNQENVQFL
ncbi:MAG: hypothetical protein JST44_27995 [Cyanobacteria bacterium SZAS LIN-5]|nr:hypothetical protein [Cyanobacteria bacterium SZAS LIN-5]